jgi:hypothetical protein
MFVMHIYLNCLGFISSAAESNQGLTVIHHTSTKAKLKNFFRKRAVSFSEVFFCFFFGQAKKKRKTLTVKSKSLPTLLYLPTRENNA